MQKLLTTKEAMEFFNVKDSKTISKFIRQGLKVIPIGQKDYRFKQDDLEEFAEHLKELAQEKIIQINPIKRKTRSRTINVDYEKRKINLELNKVIWKVGDTNEKGMDSRIQDGVTAL